MSSGIASQSLDMAMALIICPALLALAIINMAPNPFRFILNRALPSSRPSLGWLWSSGRRRIFMAVDDTSHDALDWAVERLLVAGKDGVRLLFIPEGDLCRRYPRSLFVTSANWPQALPGDGDFIQEYCARLAQAQVDFELEVLPLKAGQSVANCILEGAGRMVPELLVLGASKRLGGDDVGQTAYEVSLRSPVPVIVVK